MIASMLGTTSDNVPRFIAKKWVEVHDQPGNAEGRYNPSKQIIFKTSMLRADLCDFSDAYIIVNPIQDGLFPSCSGMGQGQKGPPP